MGSVQRLQTIAEVEATTLWCTPTYALHLLEVAVEQRLEAAFDSLERVLCTGEPGGSTLFFNLLLYKQAFNFQNYAYGATLAWLLFAITLAITLIVFRTSRRWVYYAGER